jgi:radical SAM superfamily enzyme YgiQ (UPF0313 family)
LNILLVYPHFPDTFWSLRHALKFVSKKSSFPPLGLLTVAAMLPREWSQKLVDMNVSSLTDRDIQQADYVFLSAMAVQQKSAREVIARCNKLKVKIVAGGPLFSTNHEDFPGIAHFVLGEGEVTLPLFLKDLEAGCPAPIYNSRERPKITQTPAPLWSLIKMDHYGAMSLQYSRGCPFDCEFCDIVQLNGHLPRTKDRSQVLYELDSLYYGGWRGPVFVVDDNFIGNKNKLKDDILPAIIRWQQERRFPFTLFTEVSINLADDDILMRMMTEAGFDQVFIGIETPNEESLVECNKKQNKNRDLVAAVRKVQNFGFEVQAGFILGFDSDPLSIFKSQINFIQKTGIVTAMVGLLNAPKGTKLYHRLNREGRLLQDMTGDNTDGSLNFVPKMDRDTLVAGYQQVLATIYAPQHLYDRIRTFLKEYRPQRKKTTFRFHSVYAEAFFKMVWYMGIREPGQWPFWKFLFASLWENPRLIALSITLAVYGRHFRKVAEKYIKAPLPDPI